MTWLKRLLPAIALSSILTSPSFAQITGHPFEFSAGGGMFAYDTRARLKDGVAWNGTVGYRLAPWVTAQFSGLYGPTKTDTLPEGNASLTFMSGGFRFNLRPADGKVVPYVLTEFGYGSSKVDRGSPENLSRGTPSLGAGTLINLFGHQRWYARLQVNDVMFKERDSFEFSHHTAVVASVHYLLGGRSRDQDLDKVRDWLDKCPDTPIGATVDATGCPHDSDGDGVVDGVDTCPDTPHGCKVNKTGCPLDEDGDGVCDGIDSCAATPAGAKVDAHGCTMDTDGDGVIDGIDQCENTPKGAKVDDKGCPLDADKDGVPDGIDTCPDTPAGAQVDATGCETAASKLEGELLDTGRIRISGVQWSETMPSPESMDEVSAVGEVLAKYPELKVEIGVFTDGTGKAASNLKLSQQRADAVKNNLVQKYSLNPGQVVAKGYGDKKPIASGKTEAIRAINRRMEFTVLNKAELVKAGGKRRLGAH